MANMYMGDQALGTVSVVLNTADATATAADILKDKTAYVGDKKVVGTHECEPAENLDSELATQDDLIAQIATALEGKTVPSGGGSIETSTVTIINEDYGIGCIGATIFENGEISSFSMGADDLSGFTTHNISNVVTNSLVMVYLDGAYSVYSMTGATLIGEYGNNVTYITVPYVVYLFEITDSMANIELVKE